MSSSTWRVLSGYATYQRIPMRITSRGKWAPLKSIAIVALPHDARLPREEDDTSKRLKQKLRQNPVASLLLSSVHQDPAGEAHGLWRPLLLPIVAPVHACAA